MASSSEIPHVLLPVCLQGGGRWARTEAEVPSGRAKPWLPGKSFISLLGDCKSRTTKGNSTFCVCGYDVTHVEGKRSLRPLCSVTGKDEMEPSGNSTGTAGEGAGLRCSFNRV